MSRKLSGHKLKIFVYTSIKGGADAVVAVTGPAINANNENNRVVSAVLCSALYPNIVKVLQSV